jgi:hypothetical protein
MDLHILRHQLEVSALQKKHRYDEYIESIEQDRELNMLKERQAVLRIHKSKHRYMMEQIQLKNHFDELNPDGQGLISFTEICKKITDQNEIFADNIKKIQSDYISSWKDTMAAAQKDTMTAQKDMMAAHCVLLFEQDEQIANHQKIINTHGECLDRQDVIIDDSQERVSTPDNL